MSDNGWLTVDFDKFIIDQKSKLIEKRNFILNEIENNNPLFTKNDLTRIDFALFVIEKFTASYGICNNCGVPIEFKRLQKIPETAQCLSCSSTIEN